MEKSLVRLIYRSRSNIHPGNVSELDGIFRNAVRNNMLNNISGCLAQSEGNFIQVIEGETRKVDALMDRLGADPRHTDIVILGRWNTHSRIFARWAMARPDLRPLSEESIRLLSDQASGALVSALLFGLVESGDVRYPYI